MILWLLISSTFPSPSTIRSAVPWRPVSQISVETLRWRRWPRKNKSNCGLLVEQVVNVSVEVRGWYQTKPWLLVMVISSQYCRRQTPPLPGCVVQALFQNTRHYFPERHGPVGQDTCCIVDSLPKVGERMTDPAAPLRFRRCSPLSRTMWASLL